MIWKGIIFRGIKQRIYSAHYSPLYIAPYAKSISKTVKRRLQKYNSTKCLIFKSYHKNLFPQATKYITHLFTTEKRNRNIERMMEGYTEKDYHAIQHFISESKWSARVVMDDAAQDIHRMLRGLTTSIGLLIDESSEEKKGIESVGVAHQYCGNLGKLANCQTGVFGCLTSNGGCSLIDARLQEWVDDEKRCNKAGIPEEFQVYKKKVELALDIIARQRKNNIGFHWVGADAFYGNDSDFTCGLDDLGLLFVVDIHSNHKLFLEEFRMVIPEKGVSGRGRMAVKEQPSVLATKANEYIKTLKEEDFRKVKR